MPSDFLGIDHIGVAVQDLEQAVHTYRDVLGFTVDGGETLADRGLEVRFASVGDSRLELIAATRADSEISGFLAKRGEGLHHICVRVADLERTLSELKARGARLIDETPRRGAHDRRIAFVHPKGACGVLLELVELPA
jgi:methylmalonyl-CoA/ethylmalonyl-CoA epimerase